MSQAIEQPPTLVRMEEPMVITDVELGKVTLVTDVFAELRSDLTGQLITADSADYDAARSTVNITVNRRPLVIARVADAADVAATVNFARERGLPLAVRSGGHSVARYSVIDDAVVVDFSAMKRVSIDPVARIARVQPGATSGDLAGPANAHGLALTTGDTHSVGMGGLVTGGGVGFMVRKYGLAIDNLLAAQVVTAAGEIVTASEMSHPDLFWAIRGGGGNVGIVTEFTFRLAPVDQILGGALVLPATREVLRGYLEYSVSAPEDLTTIVNLMHLPPAPFVPEARVGEPVLMVLPVWTGSIEEGERALAPLRALAEPIADVVGPMPYPAIYEFTADAAAPHGAAIRMMFADDLSDEAIDAALAAMEHSSSPYSLIQFRGLGGQFARIDKQATAFAHRDKR
jgi:FAD/FMN-containing dehydrogenase